jgi:phosphatidylserine/phosphatidylglycerophosphate/cardiolipin synthase-like enzyme
MTSYVASPPLDKMSLNYKSAWASIFFSVNKKVDFRLLVDAGCESSMIHDSFKKLSDFRFDVAVNIRSLGMKKKMHAKFFVCDDLFFYIGSHNLTQRGLNNPYEIGLSGNNPEIAQKLKTYFLKMWEVANVIPR